jgi:hypothetical protein
VKNNLAQVVYVDYSMAKAEGPEVNNGFDASQTKAVYLAG